MVLQARLHNKAEVQSCHLSSVVCVYGQHLVCACIRGDGLELAVHAGGQTLVVRDTNASKSQELFLSSSLKGACSVKIHFK